MCDDQSDEERAENLRDSIRYLVSFAQSVCGFRAEFSDCGLEATGEFQPAEMDEDEYDDIFDLLHSCISIEEEYGPSPSREYPKLVAAMKAHYFSSDLLPDVPPKAAIERMGKGHPEPCDGHTTITLRVDQWRAVDKALSASKFESLDQQNTVRVMRDLIASALAPKG